MCVFRTSLDARPWMHALSHAHMHTCTHTRTHTHRPSARPSLPLIITSMVGEVALTGPPPLSAPRPCRETTATRPRRARCHGRPPPATRGSCSACACWTRRRQGPASAQATGQCAHGDRPRPLSLSERGARCLLYAAQAGSAAHLHNISHERVSRRVERRLVHYFRWGDGRRAGFFHVSS